MQDPARQLTSILLDCNGHYCLREAFIVYRQHPDQKKSRAAAIRREQWHYIVPDSSVARIGLTGRNRSKRTLQRRLAMLCTVEPSSIKRSSGVGNHCRLESAVTREGFGFVSQPAPQRQHPACSDLSRVATVRIRCQD